jgi:hypothetical protein
VRSLAWLLFLGSSVHVASTAWLFTLRDVRGYASQRPWRYRRVPLILVLIGALSAALISPATLAWLLLPYFAWQFFHFHKQNLGLTALAASSQHLAPLTPVERRALMVAGGAGIVGLMAHPALLQLGVHVETGMLFAAARLAFLIGVAIGLVALRRRSGLDRPFGFCMIYATSLLFCAPVFVFRSPYAAVGGMTIAHGSQYLVLVGLIAGEGRGTARFRRLVLWGNIALVGGALLGGASHLHASAPAVRLLFGAYLGAVMAHFVIDAGLWRLRDPFPRMFLARHLPTLVPTPVPVEPRLASSTGIR